MKVEYDKIKFDSELEVEYYKHLEELYKQKEIIDFIYHPIIPISITDKNTYTPDFIVGYEDRIEIIETKGYNQFSFMRDNMIHNVMLSKSQEELRKWLYLNNVFPIDKKIVYKKIKYLKSFGWVDFDFKNPNTLSNQRRNKITELNQKVKEMDKKLKDFERFFSYLEKPKLTKAQALWLNEFRERIRKENEQKKNEKN